MGMGDRRQARVREILHTLPKNAQQAILDSLAGTHRFPSHQLPAADESTTKPIPS